MRCMRVYYSKVGQSCASCGTPIHNCFVIETDEGGEITVGSECAITLLGAFGVRTHETDIKRAMREWRKQQPAPHEGETREDYITRRLAEREHAKRAWQAWQAMKTRDAFGASHRNTARRRLAARGIRDPYDVAYTHRRIHDVRDDNCALCLSLTEEFRVWPQLLAQEEEAMAAEIEQRYRANRADFVGVPAWRV